jgi:hypothetical protein
VIVKGKARRITGVGFGSFSLQWDYIEANRDVVRRVATTLEDARVLYDPHGREDYEFCRLSANKIRNILTLEIPNVKEGGEVERAFKKMRSAARTFVSAAGAHSIYFQEDYVYFQRCLDALRIGILDELSWLIAGFEIAVDEPLNSYLPTRDVLFIPGDDG